MSVVKPIIIPYESKYAEETVEMWRNSKEQAIGQKEIHSFKNHVSFLNEILIKEYQVYLALIDGKVAGMIAFHDTEISQLYIHQDYQGMGIGKLLLKLAKEQAKESLQLYTFEVNKRAQSFYEKNGFEIIGSGYENEENLPDILYQWKKGEKEMKSEQQYYEEGQTIQVYMDGMSTLKEESFEVYNNFTLPNDGFVEELKKHSLHFLTITEDWCGDAMVINPVLRKLVEASGLEMRVALRDADTDLIDRHLTNGGRAIPMVLILNDQGELVGKWGPRAPEVQEIVNKVRATLPDKEDPTFAEKQEEMFVGLREMYRTDSEIWGYVYESFKGTVAGVIGA